MEAKLVMVFFANCVKCMSYDDTPPYERENFLNSRLDVLLKRAVANYPKGLPFPTKRFATSTTEGSKLCFRQKFVLGLERRF